MFMSAQIIYYGANAGGWQHSLFLHGDVGSRDAFFILRLSGDAVGPTAG